jgi:hypothetical protein
LAATGAAASAATSSAKPMRQRSPFVIARS